MSYLILSYLILKIEIWRTLISRPGKYSIHIVMTMTMKISLFDINHLNTMIRENKAEKNNAVDEQETIQNNIKCRYRRPTPKKLV